jgi:chromosome segregation ATPase
MPKPGDNLNKVFGVKDADKKTIENKIDDVQKTAEEIVEKLDEVTEGITAETSEVEPTEDSVDAKTDKIDKTNKDPYAEWTKEQLAKEMAEARKEAAKNRVALKESEKAMQQDYDKKLKELEQRFTPYIEQAQEYKKVQEKEADKKRSLEEKLAHRETKMNELMQVKEEQESRFQEEKVKLQAELEKKSAELEAYNSYWKEQLTAELAEVPLKHKKLAELLVKGAGEDPKAGLEAIKEAKTSDLFGTKKVTVYNATPTAKEGARLDAAKAQGSKSSTLTNAKQKIGEGLKGWKQKQKSRLLG